MPVHDWTRVAAGIFHHFHHEWISSIHRALNDGILPRGYYALAEQIAGGLGPDILTLENGLPAPGAFADEPLPSLSDADGGVALALAPPKVRFADEDTAATTKRKRVAVRHVSNHRVVAMIEIVSPGNKSGEQPLDRFTSKACELVDAGVHLMVIDLFPPTRHDLAGMHGAVWSRLSGRPFDLPAAQPLTIASYVAGVPLRSFAETVAVGEPLPEMPLFLTPERYVSVPLEATYQAAWAAVPEVWRRQLAQ